MYHQPDALTFDDDTPADALCPHCGHAATDGHPAGGACEECAELAQVGRYAPCALPAGAEPDDDPDGLAEELAAELTARLDPLDGPGFALDPVDRWMCDAAYSMALASANIRRRQLAADATESPALNAALWGIVGWRPGTVGPNLAATTRDRARELVDVWSGTMAQARAERAVRLGTGPRGWFAFPGDDAAQHHAFEERDLLRRSTVETLPPIYAAGWPAYLAATS